jgi:DNA-binding HxlR family transcriptional regulator
MQMPLEEHQAAIAPPPACKANPDELLQLLERRWAMVIISRLCGQPQRFSELLRAIPDISPKMMIERLKELEQYGVVDRTMFLEMPPRVEYTLTDAGQALRPAVNALLQWASSGSVAAWL